MQVFRKAIQNPLVLLCISTVLAPFINGFGSGLGSTCATYAVTHHA